MSAAHFELKKGTRFLPQIALVGLGIGTANYVLFGNFNWLQWVIQSLLTSFIIGFGLVIIGANKSWFTARFGAPWKVLGIVSLLFFAIALLSTEAEQVLRALVFQEKEYRFGTAANLYLFNTIIALVLGLSFFQFDALWSKTEARPNKEDSSLDVIDKIPVKKRDAIAFIPLEEIVYFEAFDNYSFVHTQTGEKKLCDYSLLFLESRLHGDFARIHRKYIVNKGHIEQIKPHLNGRHVLEFGSKVDAITSSKSYLPTIQKLIKIK